MPFLIAKIICASLPTHGFGVFGSGFVYQMNIKHNRLSLIILYQYFRFIHVVTLTSPSNTQGYAVRRHDNAVLRGAVGAEDNGARVVKHIQSVPPRLC